VTVDEQMGAMAMSDVGRIGRTSLEVTALSFGAAGLGNLFTTVTDEAAVQTLEAAWDAGVRYFDTAPHYGLGLSERRVGAVLSGKPRDEFVVSTKVGRILVPLPEVRGDDLAAGGFAVPAAYERRLDYSADGVRRSIEESLERLGLDRIDIALIHDPDHHEEQAFAETVPALVKLRDEGVVKAVGVGMNQSRMPARFVRETDIDVVLLAGRYSLLDRSGAQDLLPAAVERGVSVVVGGVFNSGLLVDPNPDATYDYARVTPEILAKALRLKAICEGHGVPLRAAALAFPRRHPAVASVLVGARSVHEVRDNVAMAAVEIPGALWEELAEFDGAGS
jgi:D-threo-aldose 1-dehydrogenase